MYLSFRKVRLTEMHHDLRKESLSVSMWVKGQRTALESLSLYTIWVLGWNICHQAWWQSLQFTSTLQGTVLLIKSGLSFRVARELGNLALPYLPEYLGLQLVPQSLTSFCFWQFISQMFPEGKSITVPFSILDISVNSKEHLSLILFVYYFSKEWLKKYWHI